MATLRFLRRLMGRNALSAQPPSTARLSPGIEEFTAYLDAPDAPEARRECETLVRQTLSSTRDEQGACYRHCIDKYPTIDLGYLRLAQVLPPGDARTALHTGLERCTRKSYLLQRLGELSVSLGQWDQAVVYLTSAIFAGQRLSSSGEAYLHLVPLFVAAGMEKGRWVERKGQALSGMSMDRDAQIEQVRTIVESHTMTSSTKSLLAQSSLLMQTLASAEESSSNDAAARALLASLPVQAQPAWSRLRGRRLLKKAELGAVVNWFKAESVPVTDLPAITLSRAVKLLRDFHLLTVQLSKARFVLDIEERQIERIERDGVALAYRQIFLRMGSPAPPEMDGNKLCGRYAVRTNLDTFVVFD